MNKRVLLGGIAGAIVYFIWGMVAWMGIPLHDWTMHEFDDEQEVGTILYNNRDRQGWFTIPAMQKIEESSTEKEKKAAMDDWTERHEDGPVAHVIYSDGSPPMSPDVFIRGFAIDFSAAILLALMMNSSGCCQRYFQRVGLAVAMGTFVAVVGHLSYWNWMQFPLDFTIAMCIDVVAGWFFVGLVMAAIVKPVAAEVTEAAEA